MYCRFSIPIKQANEELCEKIIISKEEAGEIFKFKDIDEEEHSYNFKDENEDEPGALDECDEEDKQSIQKDKPSLQAPPKYNRSQIESSYECKYQRVE